KDSPCPRAASSPGAPGRPCCRPGPRWPPCPKASRTPTTGSASRSPTPAKPAKWSCGTGSISKPCSSSRPTLRPGTKWWPCSTKPTTKVFPYSN
ncbi:MAG: hypothetical protein AVDCRST_MAG56-7583, partial [uncultured Cytophagales bacterium]